MYLYKGSVYVQSEGILSSLPQKLYAKAFVRFFSLHSPDQTLLFDTRGGITFGVSRTGRPRMADLQAHAKAS